MQDFRVGIRKAMAFEGLGKVARAAAWLSLFILAAHWFLVLRFLAVRAGNLGFLRLHYGVAFGIDWYDHWWYVFTFPLLGSAFFCANAWMAARLARSRPAFGTIIHVATAILEAALAAAGSIALLLNS